MPCSATGHNAFLDVAHRPTTPGADGLRRSQTGTRSSGGSSVIDLADVLAAVKPR
jgi:hypothetical protein